MAREFKHGDMRTWELAIKAIRQLGGNAIVSEIRRQIVNTETETQYVQSNLIADLTMLSVNNPKRIHFSQNKKHRKTDSGNENDVLFKEGKGQHAIYEIYDPCKHGIWEIYTDSSTKTGLSVRRVGI